MEQATTPVMAPQQLPRIYLPATGNLPPFWQVVLSFFIQLTVAYVTSHCHLKSFTTLQLIFVFVLYNVAIAFYKPLKKEFPQVKIDTTDLLYLYFL